MDSFDSKTFNTNQGHQDAPGGAVFFNNMLVYVVSRGRELNVITCAPPSGRDNWSVVAPPQDNWQTYWNRHNTKTEAPAGLSTPLVILPNPNGDSSLCVVGADSRVYLMGQDMQSFTPINIQSANGTAVASCGATAWGNYLITAWFNSGANMLMWDAYDVTQLPDPINSDFVWKPVAESGGIPGAGFPAGTILGGVVSMDWFTLGGNNFYLVTSFMSGGKTPALVITPMQNLVAQMSTSTANPCLLLGNLNSTRGVTVLRDPGGRIRLYSVAATGEDGSDVVSVATIANSSDPFGPNSSWTQEISWTQVGEGRTANQPPVGCFLLGSGYPITDPASGTANDVYEMVLFSPDHDDAVWADVCSFGTVQQLPNYRTSKLLLPDPIPNSYSYYGAVSGIIDAPFPVPASNIQNGNIPPQTSFGSVLFGATDTQSESHSANYSRSVGVSSTYETTAGFGPAWNIAYSNGSTSGHGDDDTTSEIENVPVATQLDAGGVLEPFGGFLARNVQFNFSWYRLVDLQGNWIGNGPVFCTIVPTFLSASANSFPSYLVTPGDLNSYTRASINAKAVALGLVPEGTDYIADIIEANALEIGIGGEKFMEYSVSYNTQVLPAYLQAKETWEESGWTFDLSAYAGLSGGVTVSVGLSIGGQASITGSFTAEALSGISLSSNHESTTDESKQLQIQLQDFKWPAPVESTDVAKCTFLLYFLPANQLWIQELVKATGLKLDVNSRPWRILFVVDSYTTKDGTTYP